MVLVVGGSHQGKYAFAKTLSGHVIKDFHLTVKTALEQGKDPWELVERMKAEQTDAVVTVAELGCGLIPVDAFDREYREIVGRISCELAKQAQAVYRVCCGIPTRIK